MRIKELFGEPSLQFSVTILTHKSLRTCCSDPLCPSKVTSIILELQVFQEENLLLVKNGHLLAFCSQTGQINYNSDLITDISGNPNERSHPKQPSYHLCDETMARHKKTGKRSSVS